MSDSRISFRGRAAASNRCDLLTELACVSQVVPVWFVTGTPGKAINMRFLLGDEKHVKVWIVNCLGLFGRAAARKSFAYACD